MALDQVNLELKGGKSYALIGPNGSGKTTLIKSILGLVVPTSGNIQFTGKSILNDWKYREKIGYMPQIGRYPENMRVGQLFEMMKHIRKDKPKVDEELLDAFKLYKIYDKRMHALSGGMRQKVSASLAFLFHAPVLILDEPTAGLDPVSVEILKEKILEESLKGKLIIITSHILSDLEELATHIMYLEEGQLQLFKKMSDIKAETGENRLSRIIAHLMSKKEMISL